MLAYMAFAPSVIGPMMPFLRSELHLNYTMGGLLLSTLALGMVLAGLIGDRIARRFGRRYVFWYGAVGASFGATCLAFSRSAMIGLPAVFIMGFCAGLVQVMIQAILVDLHGENQTIALLEANIAASISTCLAPFIVGGFQRFGLGWRSGLFLVVVFLILLICNYWFVPIPHPGLKSQASNNIRMGKLPLIFWIYWVIVFLVVSIEWCMNVWGADFMVSVLGIEKINASVIMSGFLGTYVIGRVIGSRLSRIMKSRNLLLLSLAFTFVGFPLFWLGRLPYLYLPGLFIVGFGVANLYPLTMSLAIGIVSEQSNLASARVSLSAGTAIFIAPLVLGWLADRITILNSYAVVIVLILVALISSVWIGSIQLRKFTDNMPGA